MTTTVSVVILNYNYARFLPAAVGSALSQTHPAVEIVVVDDASTDDSLEVLNQFEGAITVVAHNRNRGQGAAINSGAAAASGDVVWFVDADDALLPRACETLAGAVEQQGQRQHEIGKFHTQLAVIDDHGDWSGGRLPADASCLAEGDLIDHVFRFRNHGWPPMTGNAFPASTLAKILPVPEEQYRQAADSFLCEQAAICGPVVRSQEPLATYRIHGHNQFANQALGLDWLRTKLAREEASHRYLVDLADRLELRGCDPDPTAPLDVALTGYRLASLRLDPEGHPNIGAKPDRRLDLTRFGLRALAASPHLQMLERLKRAVWFLTVAFTPFGVSRVLSFYMPDGPRPPAWTRWRHRRRTRHQEPTPLIPTRRKP